MQPVQKHHSSTLGRAVERVAVLLVALGIAWFYFWTINPASRRPILSGDNAGYYNLLTSGFLKGQTALDRVVEPAMLTLKDPYSPTERAGRGLHDASYYKGRYFIYFGVTPAVAAFVPIRLLTGQFIDEKFVTAGCAVLGFWLSAGLLLSVRRRCFPMAPGWLSVLSVVMLGLATMVPALLRRPSIWEVPIAAAFACFMLTLLAVWRSLVGGRRGWIWLAVGSLAMGCAVGARPTYLLASVVLLAPLAARLSGLRLREGRRWLTAALGPILAVGIALAAYNYLRFGKVTEFGQTYQIAGDDIRGLKLFSPSYMAYNFRIYVLEPAGLSPFFPFITVIDPPVAPQGQFGIEDPYGLLPSMPWVVLLGAGFFLAITGGWRRSLRLWFFATLAAAATMGLVFCFGGTCGRYMVDFTPALMLLAGAGALAVSARAGGWARTAFCASALVLGFWSGGFGLLASLQHNGLFKAEYPEIYRRVANAANQPGHLLTKLRGVDFGPVELEVVFPRGVVGRVEPLVVTGRTFLSDYVFVHYLADDLVRFGYEHTGAGGSVGMPIRVVPGAVQKLLIEMGSLYPPEAHPYYKGMPAGLARQRQRTIRVTLNGKVGLYRSAELFDGVALRPDIGTSGRRPAFKQAFSGRILKSGVVAAGSSGFLVAREQAILFSKV